MDLLKNLGLKKKIFPLSVKIELDGNKKNKDKLNTSDHLSYTASFSGDIFQIAREGNVEAMKKYISLWANDLKVKKKILNTSDVEKITPLHLAARYNKYDMVKYLINNGANPQKNDNEGLQPLHYAAKYKRFKLISMQRGNKYFDRKSVTFEQLYDNLIKPTMRDSVILFIANSGGNVNAEDIYGCTPLHYAAIRSNEYGSVELLLCMGIDIEHKDNKGMRPIHLAISHNSLIITQLLLKRDASIICKDKYDDTPIHFAAMEGSICIMAEICERAERLGILVTALHLASSNGEIDLCELLIQYKARIDAFDNNMQTPLHKAAQNGNSEIAQFLINNGANLEKRDSDNFTPFLVAASYGHVETLKTFISNNVNIEAIDRDDKSALFWAAQENNIEAFEVLLKTESAEILMDMTDKSEISVVKRIAEYNKASVKYENEDSETPLHLAATAGHIYVVKCLIEYGSSVEAINYKMWTPLDCASDNGWTKTCKVLIESDSPIDQHDRSDLTSLMIAASKGHLTVIDLLLKHGANVHKRDNNGRNCLDLAIHHNHEEVALFLINSEYWEAVLQSETYPAGLETKMTTFRQLITHMPDVAFKVLDRCIEPDKEYSIDHINYSVTFNWRYIDDTFQNWSEERRRDSGSSLNGIDDESIDNSPLYTTNLEIIKDNHPLCIMSRAKREKLLTHPVSAQIYKEKLRYITFENAIEWIIFVLVVLFISDFSFCLVDNGLRSFWQWQVCPALALLLTWVELLLFMRKLAKFGIYIVMFTEILRTFFEFFPIFSIAIVAFSVTFYVLLSNVDGFTQIWYSLVRVLVLLIGEFDFTSMFYDTQNPIQDAHYTTSYIIFVIFVITMTILISNLLVGLAVDDIKAVQEQANLKRLAMQIDLTMDVENVLPIKLRRYFYKSKMSMYPRQRKGLFWSIFSYNVSINTISHQLKPELNKIEQLHHEIDYINEKIADLRYRIRDIQVIDANMNVMIKKILKHLDIDYTDVQARDDYAIISINS
ncbi:hypothetical protein A3Q56_05880 [Intoshia linei]|uniref:Ion transport domain-containing protein n=1 Tax=Intoshia linei TaxID=1819745 RepID=A0A177AWK3_9BILA|nr:hypothetical protein A3Q56_05880 [Intoshia linei]